MICILALIVFAVLAVFSATYRPLAKEAFDCVFRRVTFRKCRSDLNTRLKSKIVGRLMKRSHCGAKFLYKYFEVFSWVLVVLMFASLAYAAYGGYNYYLYGNCYGPEKQGFCIFDPTGHGALKDVSTCGEEGTPVLTMDLIAPAYYEVKDYKSFGNKDSNVKFVMFGCFTCEFTKKSTNNVFEIYEEYKDQVEFIFIDFPIHTHENSMESALSAYCVYDQNSDNYLMYAKSLYSHEDDLTIEQIKDYAKDLVDDFDLFNECYNSGRFNEKINKQTELGKRSNVYGTPTFFINDKSLVGPRPKLAFENIIEDELKSTKK